MKTFFVHRIGILAVGLLTATAVTRADEFADFNAAVENFSIHNRAALQYLHDDAVGPMAEEIDRMRAAWAAINGRFGAPPPQLAADRTLYTTTLVDVNMRLVGASMFIRMGSRAGVKNSLTAIRTDLRTLRKANGIELLADCVLDANSELQALVVHDKPPGDPEKVGPAASVTSLAHLGDILGRCEAMATPEIRTSPRFRALLDGMKTRLSGLRDAVAARDFAAIRRLFLELQDYDRRLALEFG